MVNAAVVVVDADGPADTASGAVRATESVMDDLVIELVEPNALVAHSGGERVGSLRWRVVDDETVELIAGTPSRTQVAAALVAAAEGSQRGRFGC